MVNNSLRKLRETEETTCEDHCLILLDYASLLDDLKYPIQQVEAVFRKCLELVIENRSESAASILLYNLDLIYKDLGDPVRQEAINKVIEEFRYTRNFQKLAIPFKDFNIFEKKEGENPLDFRDEYDQDDQYQQ